ncbi:hypothetical protein ACIO6T_37790 [Streptomyces sp. NPDC087532]|uniref:hypothetical protein n=1 Tax=Streptomyces sp. NPDC087532 TaxID=3365795 RepID=UPI00380320DF
MLLPRLDERQRRLLLAAEARLLRHSGVRTVAQVAGVSFGDRESGRYLTKFA